MKILDYVSILDGNDTTDFVAFDVTEAVYGSIVIVPSDAWATATFLVKRSPDGTMINAKPFSTPVSITTSTPYKHDMDLSAVEWLIVETGTAEGSPLRVHVNFSGKGDN